MDNSFIVETKESGHRCIAKSLDSAISHAGMWAHCHLEESFVCDKEGIIGVYYPPFINDGEYFCGAFHWKCKRNERRYNHGI